MKKWISNWLLTTMLVVSMLGCVTPDEGQDGVVVRAEQSIQITFDTMNTFLKIEHDNREFVKTKLPDVHKYAEWLRQPVRKVGTSSATERRGVMIVNSLIVVKNEYKSARTQENYSKLLQALATGSELLNEIRFHLTAINEPQVYGTN
jgi:hypothetical protein